MGGAALIDQYVLFLNIVGNVDLMTFCGLSCNHQGDDEDDDDDEAVRDDKKMEEEDDGIRIAGTGPRPEAIAIPSTTAAGGAIVSADGTMAGNVSAHVRHPSQPSPFPSHTHVVP